MDEQQKIISSNLPVKRSFCAEDRKDIITIGWNKHGEIDFGVRAAITDLDFEEMTQFRAMCMVAIGTAEDMWRRCRDTETTQSGSKENCV